MSVPGGPGGQRKVFRPNPPERGSFPLDHDAECQTFMTKYLQCLRSHRGMNDDECRALSQSYLQCRMEKNLMAPDEMKNLGFADLGKGGQQQGAVGSGKNGWSTRRARSCIIWNRLRRVHPRSEDHIPIVQPIRRPFDEARRCSQCIQAPVRIQHRWSSSQSHEYNNAFHVKLGAIIGRRTHFRWLHDGCHTSTKPVQLRATAAHAARRQRGGWG